MQGFLDRHIQLHRPQFWAAVAFAIVSLLMVACFGIAVAPSLVVRAKVALCLHRLASAETSWDGHSVASELSALASSPAVVKQLRLAVQDDYVSMRDKYFIVEALYTVGDVKADPVWYTNYGLQSIARYEHSENLADLCLSIGVSLAKAGASDDSYAVCEALALSSSEEMRLIAVTIAAHFLPEPYRDRGLGLLAQRDDRYGIYAEKLRRSRLAATTSSLVNVTATSGLSGMGISGMVDH